MGHSARTTRSGWTAVASSLLIAVVLAVSQSGCGDDFSRSALSPFYPAYLSPFAADQFLATSFTETTAKNLATNENAWAAALAQDEPVFYDRLYCLDATGELQWSLGLDGYTVETVDTSPDVRTAAVLVARWIDNDTREYRVLLVDANGQDPSVTVLRELPPPSDGDIFPAVTLARDGQSVALFLDSIDTQAGTHVYTMEVMDSSGDTRWQMPLPPAVRPNTSIAEDLSTAVFVALDNSRGAQPYVVICRAPGEITTIDAVTTGLRPDRRAEVTVSPDGRTVAVTSAPSSVSLFALNPSVRLVWTVGGPYFDTVHFNTDGRMLVAETRSHNVTTKETVSGVRVLSAADGGVLWDEEHRSYDNEIWESSMGHSMPGFLFCRSGEDASEPCRIVDLTREKPVAGDLPAGYRRFCLSYDGSVAFAIDEGGSLVSVPIP
jgi:Tol biopolymer transport system component